MRKIRKIFENKIVKFILKMVKILLELLVLFVVAIILVQRCTNNERSFLGYRVFNVATGSMKPSYNVGDIIVAKECDPHTLNVGDVIVYRGNKLDYNGKIITHKIVKIENGENGKLLFHTMGIANVVEDPIVEQSQIYGKVIHNNSILSIACKLLGNRYILYFGIILPMIIYFFYGFIKENRKKYRSEDE